MAFSTAKKSAPKTAQRQDTGERALLAIQILISPNITLATAHISKIEDAAYAKANLLHSVFLSNADRSCYENAPCGEVPVSIEMMEAMLTLAETYSYSVTEIAGGSHSKGSRHYAGVAMDVGIINGTGVSAKNKDVSGFMKACKKLGATEVLGPGSAGHATHVHAAWPRPK